MEATMRPSPPDRATLMVVSLDDLRALVAELQAHDEDTRALTFDETAERLSVSRDTVRRIVRAGELRTVRVGAREMVRLADLRAYLEP